MNTTLTFIKSEKVYVETLRCLAYESEKHWGYSDSFMDKFDASFNITELFIEQNPVFAAYEGEELRCFWGMILGSDICELEYFYVDVRYIGHGYGEKMWKHMVQWCTEHEVKCIHFVTSPQAVGFYEKMGAKVKRSVKSSIDGRMIPQLIYQIGGNEYDNTERY